MGKSSRRPSRRLAAVYRVLDANLNRAREGLRVCEEVARLIWGEPALTRRCQALRYAVSRAAALLPREKLLKARNTQGDVGRPSRRGRQGVYRNPRHLAAANVKRTQEALRVLEEFSRWVAPRASRRFGQLRFGAYSLERSFDRVRSSVRHR